MRVQFEMTPDKVKELDKLKDLTGRRTRTDVFDDALSILKWVVSQLHSGRRLVAVDDKGNATELFIAGLDSVASPLTSSES